MRAIWMINHHLSVLQLWVVRIVSLTIGYRLRNVRCNQLRCRAPLKVCQIYLSTS